MNEVTCEGTKESSELMIVLVNIIKERIKLGIDFIGTDDELALAEKAYDIVILLARVSAYDAGEIMAHAIQVACNEAVCEEDK